MVAHQLAARQHAAPAVQHQVCRALSASTHPATGCAGEDRSESAAIEKHQALLAAVQSLGKRRPNRSGDAMLGRRDIEVDDDHLRQDRVGDCALLEWKPHVATGNRVCVGLQRWRRRPEHDRYAFVLGAKHGKVARRIAHALLLLERRIVLFIDHDQPQTRHGREHRKPRSEHDIGPAGVRKQPVMQALAFSQCTVQQ